MEAYLLSNNIEVKYGLPSNVKFCKKCVISNQKPNSAIEFQHVETTKKESIFFDENDICAGCTTVQEKKNKINWEDRNKQLIDLCDRYRKKDGSYDCLVPGSGGKDSFYQAHILKYKYKQARKRRMCLSPTKKKSF